MSQLDTDIPELPERFKMTLAALNVNSNEAAIEMGVGNVKLYNILWGKGKPSFETVEQFLKAYPRVNANWLLKGQKPILHESSARIVNSGLQFVTLPVVQVSDNYLSHSMSSLTHPIVTTRDVAFYDDTLVAEVTDASMKLPIGTRLLVKPEPEAKWNDLSGLLVLIHYRTILTIRRIKENELPVKNYLTLYADNPESGHVYVKREDIKSIYRVIEIVGGGI